MSSTARARKDEPKHRDLRPYQWDAVYHITAQIADGQRELGIQSPTGSGKSLMITTILAKVVRRFFQSAIIAAPAVQIEDGFYRNLIIEGEGSPMAGSASRIRYEIDRDAFFIRPRESNLEANTQMLENHVRAKSPDVPVLLTTHQQVTKWDVESLPSDLTGRAFIADEAHRAGLKGSDATKLALFLEEWKKRGGTVLYVTATPFRSDGMRVFPEGMDPFMWTIAQHAATGEFAPSNFKIRTAIIEGAKANSVVQLSGDSLSRHEDKKGMSYLAMIKQWEEDGRPKAVFIVPGKNSMSWTKRFKALLKERNPGTRILDVVGVGTEPKKALVEALEHEQNVERYEDSKVDVILACRRFDEGTDWPLCSHVYNYGIPASFTRIIQRWGRSFRDKKGIEGYPKEHVENAHIVFFVPRVKKNVLKQFEDQHHDHACLLACYMADWETARDFGMSLRIRFEKHFSRMKRWEAKKKRQKGQDPERERIKAQQTLEVSDLARAEAVRLLAKFEAALERPPTVEEAQTYVDALNLEEEELQAVHAVITSLTGNEDPGVIDNAEDLFGTMGGISRAEVTRVYREAVAPWRHQTFSVLGATQKVYSEFTGLDANDLAERLRDRVVRPDLTLPMIHKALRAYHKEHGRIPRSKDTRVVVEFLGFQDTWCAISAALWRGGRGLPGGSSLIQEARKLGLSEVKPDFTLPMVRKAIRAFYKEHGRTPHSKDGDASEYMGMPGTWRHANSSLVKGNRGLPGGSSLIREARKLGLAPRDLLELPMVRKAIRTFHKEHGRTPHSNDGDASEYIESQDTWGAINSALYIGRRGLPGGSSLIREARKLGLSEMKPDFTLPMVRKAIRAFYKEHGRPPFLHEEATKYIGFSENWKNVNWALVRGSRGLPGGSSLTDVSVQMGLKDPSIKKPDLTLPMIHEAMRKFDKTHGHRPRPQDGDASIHFGYPETWSAVDTALLKGSRGLVGGSSLTKEALQLGLRNRKPTLTLAQVKKAIREYHKKHGHPPTTYSGDASAHFESSETWMAINAALRAGVRGLPGGSSLAKLKKEMDLGTRLTIPMVHKAIRSFYVEHRKRPVVKSGDASKYFGFPITWGTVSKNLRKGGLGLPGGSNLSKEAKKLSLKGRKS